MNTPFKDGTLTDDPIIGEKITGYIFKIEPNKDQYTLKYKIYPKSQNSTVENFNFVQKVYSGTANISFKNNDNVCINDNNNSSICIKKLDALAQHIQN
ncbi:hypothetical protein C9J40_19960 [Photobacterium sp. GB-72]|nr:hypothetical protein C9J40_19960 [Photobacterium sp. GB-72]